MFYKSSPVLTVGVQNIIVKEINAEIVTALIRCCDVDKNPVILEKISRLHGFDHHRPPLNFPYIKYLQIAEYLCAELYPRLDSQLALEHLGYRLTDFYFRTPTGQVMKNLAPVLGPYRGAKTYINTISKRFPWATHELEELRPHYLRYHVRGMPGTGAMFRGNVKALLHFSGAKLKSISTTIFDKEDWVLEAEWE